MRLHPHYDYWLQIHSLVLDGIMFSKISYYRYRGLEPLPQVAGLTAPQAGQQPAVTQSGAGLGTATRRMQHVSCPLL